jgi:hypothetical protein
MRALSSAALASGGVAGFSRAKAMKRAAVAVAAMPYQSWILGIGTEAARRGVSTRPRAVPTRLARVMRPTAVALSPAGNHRAETLVQELRKKGWAAAMPIVAARTSA